MKGGINLEEKLNLILNELQKLNSRVENIESEQQQVKQAVLETNNDVKVIKDKMDKLEQIQINQQHIIDLLSARSIQHEAELKRIK